jgi:hypothetical protein
MASLNVSDTAGVNMARFWPGTGGGTITAVVTATATQFRITITPAGGGTTYDLVYTGSGFTYSGSLPINMATGGNYTAVVIRPTGSNAAIASLTGLVAQPLSGIYSVSLATLAPLASNDTLNGHPNQASNDVLLGGAGNDTIADSYGTTRNIDGGGAMTSFASAMPQARPAQSMAAPIPIFWRRRTSAS